MDEKDVCMHADENSWACSACKNVIAGGRQGVVCGPGAMPLGPGYGVLWQHS